MDEAGERFALQVESGNGRLPPLAGQQRLDDFGDFVANRCAAARCFAATTPRRSGACRRCNGAPTATAASARTSACRWCATAIPGQSSRCITPIHVSGLPPNGRWCGTSASAPRRRCCARGWRRNCAAARRGSASCSSPSIRASASSTCCSAPMATPATTASSRSTARSRATPAWARWSGAPRARSSPIWKPPGTNCTARSRSPGSRDGSKNRRWAWGDAG